MFCTIGVAGTKTAEYCVQHAPGEMVNVKNRMCKTERCGKQPSFGVAGTKTGEYCSTVHSTHRRGLSTLRAESAEGKAVASDRRSEEMSCQIQGPRSVCRSKTLAELSVNTGPCRGYIHHIPL